MAGNKIIKSVILRAIRVYRYVFAILLPPCCRFEPTCSSYAMQALSLHGVLKGCYLTMRRLLRCHPWHPGGSDPVP